MKFICFIFTQFLYKGALYLNPEMVIIDNVPILVESIVPTFPSNNIRDIDLSTYDEQKLPSMLKILKWDDIDWSTIITRGIIEMCYPPLQNYRVSLSPCELLDSSNPTEKLIKGSYY